MSEGLRHLSGCPVPHLPDVQEVQNRVERFTVDRTPMFESGDHPPVKTRVAIERCCECGQQAEREV